ncbi:amidohydrolase [Paenibacillus oenotherae]|uniref:Amidohydrolase n=1 Tax=Paenibacillus oenotherae TaxID=1435645 RepID=A0ABS7D3C1_9BACL|nr:amidohydrolase family protein [Paenibacillus oenotherae]MBW7474354.1 amidohydrolase [Paenibacillus oenotherae]
MNKKKKHRNTLYAMTGTLFIGIIIISRILFHDDADVLELEKREGSGSELSLTQLIELYGGLPLADVHNHGASSSNYTSIINLWQRNGVDRIVLFGDVSEPSAVNTDETAWEAYEAHPDVIIPFFSGIDLHDPSSVEVAREKLERGYYGIGEIAAASTHSPLLANVPWKTEHPMDGYLPQLYELCAEYKAPLLLHIDPPSGVAVDKLEEALEAYPDTTFIFAHANVYNSPDNIRRLLAEHPNLYVDFYAGFTAFNSGSNDSLEDFVEVMRAFPDRFLLSTDSGFGLRSKELAIEAMYGMIHSLDDRKLAAKIAYENFDALMKRQPATRTQLQEIRKLKGAAADRAASAAAPLTKMEAGLILLGQR